MGRNSRLRPDGCGLYLRCDLPPLEWPWEEWPPPCDLGACGALNFGAEKCFSLGACCEKLRRDMPCCDMPCSDEESCGDETRAFEKCSACRHELDLAVREGSGLRLLPGLRPGVAPGLAKALWLEARDLSPVRAVRGGCESARPDDPEDGVRVVVPKVPRLFAVRLSRWKLWLGMGEPWRKVRHPSPAGRDKVPAAPYRLASKLLP